MKISPFLTFGAGLIAIALMHGGCTTPHNREDRAARARQFIATHEATFRPLDKEAGITWWNANLSGKDEDFKAKEAAQNKLDAALSDRARFAELKALKQSNISEP